MERDPFDTFLDRCAREVNLQKEFGKDGAQEITEDICQNCFSIVPRGSRHCPQCGNLQSIPENVSATFKQRTVIKRHLAVTLLSVEYGVEIDGKTFTRIQIKINNLSQKRVHISLTYVDSVVIDLTGRQYTPVDNDEFTEDPGIDMFPTWFYIYPDAYREGVILFRESPVPLQKAIFCTMHQENEDELFVFDMNPPPKVDG